MLVIKKKSLYISYSLVLLLLSFYSYALVDPNFTLFNHIVWEGFRNIMVQLGYYHRSESFIIFIFLIAILFYFNWLFTSRLSQKTNPVKLGLLIAGLLLFSYPFLSHDFFNYLFDAKILTFYGQNPYLHKALDFPQDHWIRFMHWTHRTYPYGPVFLVLTLIPSFLSLGKLILAFFFFKLMFIGFYLLAISCLTKIDKKAALFFATSPLVIMEGLVNNHNDLIALSLGIVAIYFLFKQKQKIISFLFILFAAGIKYVTIVFLPLLLKDRKGLFLVFFTLVLAFIYIYTKVGIHSWYFLNLLVFLPYLKKQYLSLSILTVFLFFSYYPYIVLGGWDTTDKVIMKERIIMTGVILSLVWFYRHAVKRFLKSRQ